LGLGGSKTAVCVIK